MTFKVRGTFKVNRSYKVKLRGTIYQAEGIGPFLGTQRPMWLEREEW